MARTEKLPDGDTRSCRQGGAGRRAGSPGHPVAADIGAHMVDGGVQTDLFRQRCRVRKCGNNGQLASIGSRQLASIEDQGARMGQTLRPIRRPQGGARGARQAAPCQNEEPISYSSAADNRVLSGL